eukprot:scaffold9517_cov31-Tisochrysis_lutea.AAC.1
MLGLPLDEQQLLFEVSPDRLDAGSSSWMPSGLSRFYADSSSSEVQGRTARSGGVCCIIYPTKGLVVVKKAPKAGGIDGN